MRTAFLTGCLRNGFVVEIAFIQRSKKILHSSLKLLSYRLHLLITSSWLLQRGATPHLPPRSSRTSPNTSIQSYFPQLSCRSQSAKSFLYFPHSRHWGLLFTQEPPSAKESSYPPFSSQVKFCLHPRAFWNVRHHCFPYLPLKQII